MAVKTVALRLGALSAYKYLTVKDLTYDGSAYTLYTDTLRGVISLKVGKTLIAYVEAGKVVSKVVTVTEADSGKDVLSIAVDLAVYNEANRPIPEDLSEVVEAVTALRSRLVTLESQVTEVAQGQGGGMSEDEVNRMIERALDGYSPSKELTGITFGDAGSNSSVIQAALDAGGEVVLPAGYIRVTAPLVLRSNTHLRGAGRGRTILYANTKTSAQSGVVNLHQPAGGPLDNVVVEDMTIRAENRHVLAGSNIRRSQFQRLELIQRSAGFSIFSSQATSLLLECTFSDLVSYAYGKPRTVPAWNILSASADAVTQTVWERVVFWHADFENLASGDDTQFMFRMESTQGTNRLRNNVLREVTLENARGGGISLVSVTGTKLEGIASWDIPTGQAKGPVVRLGRNSNATTGCQDTLLERVSRVGYEPASGVVDIELHADAVRTTLLHCFVSGSGRALQVDMKRAPATVLGLPATTAYLNPGSYTQFTQSGVNTSGGRIRGLGDAVAGDEAVPLSQVQSLVAAGGGVGTSDPKKGKADVFDTGRRYFSPVTYFWPDFYKEDSQWRTATQYGDETGFVILNRNSGTWDAFDADFNTQGLRARGRGAKVCLFYVKTQYGAAGNKAWQAGVPNPDLYTQEHILDMVRNVKAKYPDLTGDDAHWGVFLDEFINGWADHEERVPWYQDLVAAIRKEFPDIWLIGNPGVNISPEVLALDVDCFMSFEGDADRYVRNDPASPVHPDHMAAEPSTRFWHVVHGVTRENYQSVLAAASGYGVSHLYVTNLNLVENPDNGGQWVPEGNPYAEAPGDWLYDPTAAWLARVDGVEKRLALAENSAPGALIGARVLVLGAEEAVPEGTPAGTIIVREATA